MLPYGFHRSISLLLAWLFDPLISWLQGCLDASQQTFSVCPCPSCRESRAPRLCAEGPLPDGGGGARPLLAQLGGLSPAR